MHVVDRCWNIFRFTVVGGAAPNDLDKYVAGVCYKGIRASTNTALHSAQYARYLLLFMQHLVRRMPPPLRYAPSLPRSDDYLVEFSQDVRLSISQGLQSGVQSGGNRAQPPCICLHLTLPRQAVNRPSALHGGNSLCTPTIRHTNPSKTSSRAWVFRRSSATFDVLGNKQGMHGLAKAALTHSIIY